METSPQDLPGREAGIEELQLPFTKGAFLLPGTVRKNRTELLNGVFFNPGNIRTADRKLFCNLSLGLFLLTEKPVAAAQHLIFLFCEKLWHSGENSDGIVSDCTVFHNVNRSAFDHIQKADLIAFLVCSDRLVEGHLSGMFLFGAEEHEELICYPPLNAFLMH